MFIYVSTLEYMNNYVILITYLYFITYSYIYLYIKVNIQYSILVHTIIHTLTYPHIHNILFSIVVCNCAKFYGRTNYENRIFV